MPLDLSAVAPPVLPPGLPAGSAVASWADAGAAAALANALNNASSLALARIVAQDHATREDARLVELRAQVAAFQTMQRVSTETATELQATYAAMALAARHIGSAPTARDAVLSLAGQSLAGGATADQAMARALGVHAMVNRLYPAPPPVPITTNAPATTTTPGA
jgi:hypothetical protein